MELRQRLGSSKSSAERIIKDIRHDELLNMTRAAANFYRHDTEIEFQAQFGKIRPVRPPASVHDRDAVQVLTKFGAEGHDRVCRVPSSQTHAHLGSWLAERRPSPQTHTHMASRMARMSRSASKPGLDAQIDLARDRMALMDRTWAGSDFVRTRGRVPRGKRRRLPIAAESIDGEDSDHRG